MPSVLFVCTANQFRSPLAAAFMHEFIRRGKVSGKWRVESAGTWTKPGLPASMLASQLANRLGADGLGGHASRQVTGELLQEFDLIIVMEIGHMEAIASEFPFVVGRLELLSRIADGANYDIQDPVNQGGDPVAVAIQLQMLIKSGGARILKLARSHQRTGRAHEKGDS